MCVMIVKTVHDGLSGKAYAHQFEPGHHSGRGVILSTSAPMSAQYFGPNGVASRSGEKPSLFGVVRRGVSSAGVTFRVNLAGLP